MPNYFADGYWSVGGVQSPLTTSLSNPLLLDADPALYFMCKYYDGVLKGNFGPRWDAAIASAGLSNLDGYSVNEVLPYDPFRTGLSPQNNWRFPMLAIYPVATDYLFRTVALYSVIRDFELLFSLPPLTSEQWEYLHPFLQYVEKVIVDRTLQGFDSNFNAGELVWKESGIEKITIMGKSKYGNIPYGTNLHLPTLLMKIQVSEQRTPDTRGAPALTGFDNTVSTLTVGPDGYVIVNQKINL